MIRSVAVLVAAILMSRPTMPPAEAKHYAEVLNEEGRKHAFDPLTVVAIVHFESRWQPWAVSADGEDYGLGQVRARYVGACRNDEDPVGNPSEACKAAKASLLAGDHNLRRVAALVTANRELCKEKVGSADLPRWLAGYEGLNAPSRDRWCAPGAKTWQVVAYRKQLLGLFLHPRRAATATAPAKRERVSPPKGPSASRPAGRVALPGG